jgi:hypothetical protein
MRRCSSGISAAQREADVAEWTAQFINQAARQQQ